MNIYVKFDVNAICKQVLKKQLDSFGLEYTLSGIGEVKLTDDLSKDKEQELADALENVGIFIVDDTKAKLAHQVKETIIHMIYNDKEAHRYKTSTYLAGKLNYSYTHLSNVFSQTTLVSIENFIILTKIDYAKKLIIENKLSFSEIAHKLNYSSSSHLSAQFKKTTGLTPSNFQRLVRKRKERRIVLEKSVI
ncbi:helix-turn-helix domain-containing protein [Pricia sp.]|uniref:helix-turn-helix domain-containing protein n=1 Tax=Pricia sp. TaxID=2268138 RepID=UPI00359487B7